MLREHVAAWVTVAFAILLILLTVSDQGPGAMGASVILLLWATAMLGLFLAVEQSTRRHRGPRGRVP